MGSKRMPLKHCSSLGFWSPKWSFGSSKNFKFTDIEANRKKFLPAPNIYNTRFNWGEKDKTKKPDLKARKNTFIDQIMRKQKDMPAPNLYMR